MLTIFYLVIQKDYQKPVGDWRTLWKVPIGNPKSGRFTNQASDHYAFWEPLLYARVAKLLGKPVIVRFGGSFDKFYGESTPTQQKMIERALQIPMVSLFYQNGGRTISHNMWTVPRFMSFTMLSPRPPPQTEAVEMENLSSSGLLGLKPNAKALM